MSFLRVLIAAAFLLPLFVWSKPTSDDPALAQQELAAVLKRLRAVETKVAEQQKARGGAQAALRDAERAASRARAELQALDKKLRAAREQLSQLEAKAAERARELAAERSALAQQLRYAYMSGRNEWLRVLLSGNDPVTTGRQMVYFAYLSEARGELVDAVSQRLLALQAARNDAARQADQLRGLQAEADARSQSLAQARAERAAVLAKLDEDISGRQGEAAGLRQQAEQLTALVEELTRALVDLPVGDDSSFGSRKGAMRWPADGSLLRRFGERRADGQLKWEGALIGAAPGSEVRAVHRGRVIFADWLAGMGMLVVVDHGEGFMTLYAHNEDLLCDVGDWVGPEQVLAHVGDTGGRAEAGLYFEIRRNGRPLDPRPWLKK